MVESRAARDISLMHCGLQMPERERGYARWSRSEQALWRVARVANWQAIDDSIDMTLLRIGFARPGHAAA